MIYVAWRVATISTTTTTKMSLCLYQSWTLVAASLQAEARSAKLLGICANNVESSLS